MKCEDALLLISGHLDHTNTREEETALQAHLCGCEACRGILRAFEEADAGVASLKERAPQDLRANVMAQIGKETKKRRYCPWFSAAIAAMLVLVVGVSAMVDLPENAAAPQTASLAEAYTVSRSTSAVSADTLADQIAREREATVAVIHELYYEVETFPCETLEEGYLLYRLPDQNAAIFLSENYGCVIYKPAEPPTAVYALLVP